MVKQEVTGRRRSAIYMKRRVYKDAVQFAPEVQVVQGAIDGR